MSLDIVDAITGCFDLMEIVFSKVRKLVYILVIPFLSFVFFYLFKTIKNPYGLEDYLCFIFLSFIAANIFLLLFVLIITFLIWLIKKIYSIIKSIC